VIKLVLARKMVEIVPSILSADFARLAEEIGKVERGGARLLHLDVMDGHFVPNLTIGPPVVESVRKITKLHLDVHLMIENPERYVETFVRAGADSVSVLEEIAEVADYVLLMSVNPGFGGQKLIPYVLDKVRKLDTMRREKQLALTIEIDGGVHLENLAEVVRAGCDWIVTGSAIFHSADAEGTVRQMREIAAHANALVS